MNEDETIDYEPEDEMGTVGAVKAKMQKLRDELEKTKAERQEYLDGWQRAKADAVNMRKDLLAQAERQGNRAKEGLLEDLIPALDSFDMAALSEAWASVSDGFRSGMEQVQNQLLNVLKTHGVERFGKVGDTFDHALYDAVEERDDMAGESGTIGRILRYGYKMGSRVIRPAQVIVKK